MLCHGNHDGYLSPKRPQTNLYHCDSFLSPKRPQTILSHHDGYISSCEVKNYLGQWSLGVLRWFSGTAWVTFYQMFNFFVINSIFICHNFACQVQISTDSVPKCHGPDSDSKKNATICPDNEYFAQYP